MMAPVSTTDSSPRFRRRLATLAFAAAAIGLAHPALAQMDDYGDYLPRAYRYDDGGRYGYAPPPPAAIPPRAIGRVAQREFGLAEIDRMVRTEGSYVVDGTTAAGTKTRLIFDRYSGRLVDRVVLGPQPERKPARVVRLDPEGKPQAAKPRLVPRPPVRPPELKPTEAPVETPVEARAPATQAPPSPAEIRPAPEPTPPAPAPAPVEASVPPATQSQPEAISGSGEPQAEKAPEPTREEKLIEAQAPPVAALPAPPEPIKPAAEPGPVELAPVVPLY